MHILYVSDVYFPRVNGVSTSVCTFRDELHRLGHRTTLVAPHYPGVEDRDEDGIVRVPARAVPGDPEDRAMVWRALRAALEDLRGQSFDLVHVQTPFLAHYAGVRFARQHRIPSVATYHTSFEEYLHHYLPGVPRCVARGAARRLSRAQCNAVHTVIVPSTAMAQALQDYGVTQPVEIVPTGIAVGTLSRGDGAAFRRAYGIPARRPMLLYVGRVAHEKNIPFLLHMFVDVHAAVQSAVLVICGAGPALARLRRLVQELGLGDSVRFLGYLDRHGALPDCYAAADLFVFASHTETQGLVLLEALAAGTPVVAIAAMGTRDVLREDGGARIAPDDETGFAQAVVDLLRDGAARAALAAAAPPYAAKWDAASMARRLEAVYARLVRAARERGADAWVTKDVSLPSSR